jgi:hypothetical protein
MLRFIFVFLLAVASTSSNAFCGGGLNGESPSLQIYIGTGDCEYHEEMIIVSSVKTPVGQKSYKFNRECEYVFDKSGLNIGFRCRDNGSSPLAGTYYRARVSSTETQTDPCEEGAKPFPLTYYACTRGCNERVPARFYNKDQCD